MPRVDAREIVGLVHIKRAIEHCIRGRGASGIPVSAQDIIPRGVANISCEVIDDISGGAIAIGSHVVIVPVSIVHIVDVCRVGHDASTVIRKMRLPSKIR